MDRSEKLIDTIKQRQIRPLPKWVFFLRNSLFFCCFLVAVLLGALAFSVVLFAIQQTDFSVLAHLSHSRLELFLGLLPLFWMVLLIIALLIAMYGIAYSRKGYKFTLVRQIGFSALLSILLGALFFVMGGARQLEQAFELEVALYQSIQEKKTRLWMAPEEGRLAGEIQKVGPGALQLRDFSGNTWTIDYQNAFYPPVVLLEPGEQIKLLGAISGGQQFRAEEIRPWQGPGFRRQGGRRGSEVQDR